MNSLWIVAIPFLSVAAACLTVTIGCAVFGRIASAFLVDMVVEAFLGSSLLVVAQIGWWAIDDRGSQDILGWPLGWTVTMHAAFAGPIGSVLLGANDVSTTCWMTAAGLACGLGLGELTAFGVASAAIRNEQRQQAFRVARRTNVNYQFDTFDDTEPSAPAWSDRTDAKVLDGELVEQPDGSFAVCYVALCR